MMTRYKVVLITVAVILVGVLFGMSNYTKKMPDVVSTTNIGTEKPPRMLPSTEPNTPVTRSWYQSNTKNIRFALPEGWVVDDSANTPSPPAGFTESTIFLRKADSACAIVVAERDTTVSGTHKQISFADRVFSSYAQFDGYWWLASTSASAKYSFSSDTRQYLPGEFRVASNLRNSNLILFMSDGTAVPDDCNGDFNALLKTVEPYYETTHLAPSSKGILTAEKVWDDVTHNAPNKSYEHLVFTDDDSKERREVMKIPPNTWAGRFSVLGGKLYIPAISYKFDDVEKRFNSDSALYVLDPFNGQTTQIPGTTQADTYISSLFLWNGNAHYLASSSSLVMCLDGYRPCAADLYSIPLAGGKPTFIAHSSLGGSVFGYVESEGVFYVRQDWGDAGCVSISINRIVSGKEESVGRFNECFGESEADNIAYKQMQEKVNAITTKVGSSKVSSTGIRIENNTLKPASGDVSGDAIFYFDKFNTN